MGSINVKTIFDPINARHQPSAVAERGLCDSRIKKHSGGVLVDAIVRWITFAYSSSLI